MYWLGCEFVILILSLAFLPTSHQSFTTRFTTSLFYNFIFAYFPSTHLHSLLKVLENMGEKLKNPSDRCSSLHKGTRKTNCSQTSHAYTKRLFTKSRPKHNFIVTLGLTISKRGYRT